jgi:hypothetical protein
MKEARAIYDNPQLMRRELWINGEMACSISFELLASRSHHVALPDWARSILIGPWKDGNVVGDRNALFLKGA